jgi:hypothetical protein
MVPQGGVDLFKSKLALPLDAALLDKQGPLPCQPPLDECYISAKELSIPKMLQAVEKNVVRL